MYSWERLLQSLETTQILERGEVQAETISAEVEGSEVDGSQVIAAYDASEDTLYINDNLFDGADVALSAVRRELEDEYGGASVSYRRNLSPTGIVEETNSARVQVNDKAKRYI